MPEDVKNTEKRSNPKEQRRPRHGRHQAQAEKKVEKKAEEPKPVPKVPQKPEYEAPGPEFYKNLKRETDEILKITEEENKKYKKKEIQSNWSKYEMPIESYEEIEEQENMGADFEKLIQAPLSVGGHFQFKHEKSWDLNTAPSLYDKYFEINMDNLSLALSTIPFYERNSIEQSVFTETDMLSINNRATRFKQKYYNDKSYTTPEIEASDKILNSLKENINSEDKNISNMEHKNDSTKTDDAEDDYVPNTEHIEINFKNYQEDKHKARSVLDDSLKVKIETPIPEPITIKDNPMTLNTDNDKSRKTGYVVINTLASEKLQDNKLDDDEPKVTTQENFETKSVFKSESQLTDNNEVAFDDLMFGKLDEKPRNETIAEVKKVEAPMVPKAVTKVAQSPPAQKKNPVIESPEDLEKWLDDFLDG